MTDREPRTSTPRRPADGAVHADANETERRLVEEAAVLTRRLSLALIDALIAVLRAPDGGTLSAARRLADVAASSGAAAARLPDSLAEAASLAPPRPRRT